MKTLTTLLTTAAFCAIAAGSIAATTASEPKHLMTLPDNPAPTHFSHRAQTHPHAATPQLRPLTDISQSRVHPQSSDSHFMQSPESRRDFLNTLHSAQRNLQSYNREEARRSIDHAISLINTPETAKRAYSHQEYKVIEVSYGANAQGDKAFSPVLNNETAHAVQSLVSNNAGEIRNAEVKYLSFDLKKQDVQRNLYVAQRALADDNMTDAITAIQAVQEALTSSTDPLVAANVEAADHIALSRALADQGEYLAASTALNKAKVAYGWLERGTDDVVALRQIKRELASLDAILAGTAPQQIASR